MSSADSLIRHSTMKTDFRNFIDNGISIAEDTWRSLGGSEHHYRFGPVTVAVRIMGNALVDVIDPAIHHRCLENPPAKISGMVYALDATAVGVSLPPEDWPFKTDTRDHLQRVHWQPSEGLALASDEPRGIWHLFDLNRRVGLYWIRSATDLPSWEPGAPLRYFIHWLALLEGAQLVHAAGIERDGRGLLLTGAGGSGKSTTTAAAVASGWYTAGDDFVLIDGLTHPLAYGIYDTVKLSGMALEIMPHIANCAVNPQRPADDKARIHLCQSHSNQLVETMPISALLSIRIAHSKVTRIVPTSKAAIMRALAPSTLFLLRTGMQESFARITVLIRQLPCYSIELGRDPFEAVDALERIAQSLKA